MSTWRQHAKQIVYRVVTANAGKTPVEIRKALRDAYPYGVREHYPYKVWCEEVRRAMLRVDVGNQVDRPNEQLNLFNQK